ncbi:MAG: class I SAM-dependent DNA methyltransferase [Arenicella sp.]
MKKDYFEHKANDYEQQKQRVANVENIANVIKKNIQFNPSMHIMDFGSGTGLLLERIAPFVKKITAIDISTSMNRQLEKKRKDIQCELDIIEMDLSTSTLDKKFDGIISSMTMHHIEDIPLMLEKLHSMLNTGGFIAIADLDTEDGSFHREDTGVFHTGFDRDYFKGLALSAGFRDISSFKASTVKKAQGDYSVFLISAVKA